MAEAYPRDYAGARRHFEAAVKDANASFAELPIKAVGPDGEPLSIATARIGDEAAHRLLVVGSGIHGVELFGGSICQVAWLQQLRVPPDSAVLLIHAMNPWGAAHWRRNNELNIDLCRNFIDFQAPSPENPDYESVHDHAGQHGNPDTEGLSAKKALDQLAGQWGLRRFNEALLGGQYKQREGFSFGGYAASESRKLLERSISEHAASAEQVAIVELHSGIGAFGLASCLCMQDAAAAERLCSWVSGPVQAPFASENDDPELPRVHGHSTFGYERLLSPKTLTSAVVELGTYPHQHIMNVLLEDHWREHANVHPAQAALIQDALLEAFAPDAAEWHSAVCANTVPLLNDTLTGLST